jgi:hypothetical protein
MSVLGTGTTWPLRADPEPRASTAARPDVVVWVLVGEAVVFTLGIWLRWSTIVTGVYWNADAAAAPVIASTFSHAHGAGTLLLHFGYFTTLGWELATRPLPFHREVWEATPYAFWLGSAGLLTWAARVVAGRWAGAATLALSLCTAPLATYGLFTLNFHSSTWFSTAALGSYVVAARRLAANRGIRLIALSAAAGAVAGVNAASDPLLVYTALIPLATTAALMLAVERGAAARFAAGILCLLASAAVLGEGLAILMRHLRFTVVEQPAQLAALDDLWPNTARFGEQVLTLLNGDFWAHGFGATRLLALTCTLIVCGTALVALVAAARLLTAARDGGTRQRDLPYVLFWVLVPLTVGASYIFSTVGSHGGWYFISFVYAFAALLPVLLSGLHGGRVAATALVSVCCLSAFLGAQTRWSTIGAVPDFSAYVPRLERLARANHASVAYGDYWTALPVTWADHLRLPMYPVRECASSSSQRGRLCRFVANLNTNWYVPRPRTRSLLLVRPGDIYVQNRPSPSLGHWLKRLSLGGFTVYVYSYDIADRLGGRLPFGQEQP